MPAHAHAPYKQSAPSNSPEGKEVPDPLVIGPEATAKERSVQQLFAHHANHSRDIPVQRRGVSHACKAWPMTMQVGQDGGGKAKKESTGTRHIRRSIEACHLP